MTFDAALQMIRRGGYDGIGIVLDRSFGLVGYDADVCINGGTISETARKHIAARNSYTEISLSGSGLHVLARGELPPGRRKRDGGSGAFQER
jgi:putative DNA primase/helicase